MTVRRLTTDRLVLRPWRPGDAGDVAAAHRVYREPEVARWLGAVPRPDATPDDSRERLARWARVTAEAPDGLGLWAVTVDDDVPVGTVLLSRLPDEQRRPTDDVEIGWHLHPEVWGRGYATEAARAVLDHGLGTVGLEEVHAVAWAGNDPSFAVMRRLGMHHHGATDRWYGVRLEWWSTSTRVGA